MWKYECKKHLVYVLIGMAVGALLFGTFAFQREILMASANEAIAMLADTLPKESLEMVTNVYASDLFYYVMGAIEIGGLVNGLMLGFYLLKKYNLNSLIVMAIIFFAGSFVVSIIELIGAFLLIPTIIVCIYGMLTIPNKEARKNLDKNKTTNLSEFVRLYEIEHEYDASYEKVGKQYARTVLFINMLYVIGFAMALILVAFFANNMLIVMAAVALYFVLYYFINKIKASAAMNIRSILYNECNPVGCASAIIAASKASFPKKLVLEQFMAMSLIYMEDPSLAIDALKFAKKPMNNQIDYTYHGLMAYAYYQLGDESMVQQHLDIVNTPTSNPKAGIQIINMLKIQTIEGIKAKLAMMQQNFNFAKKYYLALLANVRFPSVIVEINYYLGLIAFVEQDFEAALRSFEYVASKANTMAFKAKANSYIEKLQVIIESLKQQEVNEEQEV